MVAGPSFTGAGNIPACAQRQTVAREMPYRSARSMSRTYRVRGTRTGVYARLRTMYHLVACDLADHLDEQIRELHTEQFRE